MFAKLLKLLNTSSWRAAVSTAVGAAVSYGITKWSKVDVGYLALFTTPIAYAYHWVIVTGEKKLPWLSWLLLSLPQTLPVKPVVTPPTPAPTPSGTRKPGK